MKYSVSPNFIIKNIVKQVFPSEIIILEDSKKIVLNNFTLVLVRKLPISNFIAPVMHLQYPKPVIEEYTKILRLIHLTIFSRHFKQH